MVIEHELYLGLIGQAYAVATYLIRSASRGAGDARDAMRRAADHVTALAGYQGDDANNVSDALWHGLRVKMHQPQRYELSLA
jgi:hypothetical protein